MMRTLRDHQRGAMLPIICGAMLLLCTLAYGGFTLLRVTLARQEAQRAADAAVLVAANIVKHEGLPFDALKQARAQDIANKNSGTSLVFEWQPIEETPDKVDITVKVTSDVQAPAFIFLDNKVTVSATAKGTAGQRTITDAEKRNPRLVLVLDYSGSMNNHLVEDGNLTTIQALLNAVHLLLDKNYEVQYGLVIFGSGVLAQLPTGFDRATEVRQLVDSGDYGCPTGGGSCGTGSGPALQQAFNILNDDEKDDRFVLFVSDGEPTIDMGGNYNLNQAQTDAYQQAVRLWSIQTRIFTLHLVNQNTSGSAASLKQFMISISGGPSVDNQGVEKDNYYAASSEDQLKGLFGGIVSAISCRIGPLDPPPPNPTKMHVFMRAPGTQEDIVLTNAQPLGAEGTGDLWDEEQTFHTGNYYFYDKDMKLIFVTPPVCDMMTKQDYNTIVRFVSPQLSE